MSSVRKRKNMLRRLNTYFENHGELIGEREYSKDPSAPFRLYSIKKYLGGWNRMVYYLGFYYPRWKAPAVVTPEDGLKEAIVEKTVETKKPKTDPLEALRSASKDKDES